MVQATFQNPVRVWRLEEEVNSLRERTRIPTLDWVSWHPAVLGLLLPVLQHRLLASFTIAATCKLAHLIAAETVVWLVQHLLLVSAKSRSDSLTWACVQDDNSWVGLTPLEGGMFSVTNVHWPNVALKKGALAQVQCEAHTLSVLAHPNIVPVVGIVKTAEVLNDGQPAAYLAMKRQAVSLESKLQTTRSVLPPLSPDVLHLSLQPPSSQTTFLATVSL